MSVRPRVAWGYAFLLVLLFAIAALAARTVIDYLQTQVPVEEYRMVTTLISALSLGFMLIAGAFGLWAIQFAAGAESRQQIGHLVDTMDYLPDGLLAVDRKGHIKGANPAMAALLGTAPPKQASLGEVFQCLSEEDTALLLKPGDPCEVERRLVAGGSTRTLRFRSMPSEGLMLLLVSDVTSAEAQKARNRQVARLQLIGQLARGVAHDFNNILCAISGHATLMSRTPGATAEGALSLRAVIQNADRGIALASHLLELSHPPRVRGLTLQIEEHVRAGGNMLRDSLAEGWQVEVDAREVPSIALAGMEIEQAIVNLGMLIADAAADAGTIRISVAPPASAPLFEIGPHFSCAVVLVGKTPRSIAGAEEAVGHLDREAGAIQSVIQSMLHETGGRLDCLAAQNGLPVYRICLPPGTLTASAPAQNSQMLFDLSTYVADWRVVFSVPAGEHDEVIRRLRDYGIAVERYNNLISVLARLEESQPIDAIVVDSRLLGDEVRNLLRAIVKLRSSVGVVVLAEHPGVEWEGVTNEIVFLDRRPTADAAITAIVEAKSIASQRRRKT